MLGETLASRPDQASGVSVSGRSQIAQRGSAGKLSLFHRSRSSASSRRQPVFEITPVKVTVEVEKSKLEVPCPLMPS